MVHDIVECGALQRLLPELLCLLFREATERESGSWPVRIASGIHSSAWICCWSAGDVVRVGRPAEERGPPVGVSGLAAIRVGFLGGGGIGPDRNGSEGRERSRHSSMWEENNADIVERGFLLFRDRKMKTVGEKSEGLSAFDGFERWKGFHPLRLQVPLKHLHFHLDA